MEKLKSIQRVLEKNEQIAKIECQIDTDVKSRDKVIESGKIKAEILERLTSKFASLKELFSEYDSAVFCKDDVTNLIIKIEGGRLAEVQSSVIKYLDKQESELVKKYEGRWYLTNGYKEKKLADFFLVKLREVERDLIDQVKVLLTSVESYCEKAFSIKTYCLPNVRDGNYDEHSRKIVNEIAKRGNKNFEIYGEGVEKICNDRIEEKLLKKQKLEKAKSHIINNRKQEILNNK